MNASAFKSFKTLSFLPVPRENTVVWQPKAYTKKTNIIIIIMSKSIITDALPYITIHHYLL
jgi:hypothetical protein